MRCNSHAEITKFLRRDVKAKRVKHKKIILKRVKRTCSTKQKLYVIYLRYGSTNDYSKVLNRWTDISKITSIKQDTCRKIVKAFHEKNNQINSNSKRGRTVQPLPPDVSEYLKTSLLDNKFLSLRQRVKIIEHELGFPITLRRLWSSYHRMGIKYRAADSVLANSHTLALR